METINSSTEGAINLTHTNVNLSGNSTNLAAAFDGTVTTHTGVITIDNDDYSLDELKTINNANSNEIILEHPGVDFSGSSSDIAAALSGTITTHTGNITITNNDYTAAELKVISDATDGDITLDVANVALDSTSSILEAAFDNVITTHTGTISISNSDYTTSELKAIGTASSGDITLVDPNVDISGTSSNLVAALAGVVTDHTGDITISNVDYNVTQLKTINAATTGDIILQQTGGPLSGSAADLVLAFTGTITEHTGTVEITGTYNTAQLKTINTATTGQITLANPSVDIDGSSADLAAAFAGLLLNILEMLKSLTITIQLLISQQSIL